MTRLIDAEKQAVILKKAAAQMLAIAQSSYDTGWAKGLIDAADTLKNATTIDAVPVVRCKDCKWFLYDDDVDYVCVQIGKYMGFDDFCSHGERNKDAAGQ